MLTPFVTLSLLHRLFAFAETFGWHTGAAFLTTQSSSDFFPTHTREQLHQVWPTSRHAEQPLSPFNNYYTSIRRHWVSPPSKGRLAKRGSQERETMAVARGKTNSSTNWIDHQAYICDRFVQRQQPWARTTLAFLVLKLIVAVAVEGYIMKEANRQINQYFDSVHDADDPFNVRTEKQYKSVNL